MTITNISKLKNNALIAAANPVPFNLVVDSQQPATVLLTLTYTDGPTIATGLEMLKHKTDGTFQYFTCDLQTILQSTFDNIDDDTQGAFSWKNMHDMVHDITLHATVTNTASEVAVLTLDFTIANISRQFEDDITICDSPEHIYDTCEMETIYVGKDNLGYIYVFSNTADRLGLTEDSALYFCDYDDVYFCDYNDNLFYEK